MDGLYRDAQGLRYVNILDSLMTFSPVCHQENICPPDFHGTRVSLANNGFKLAALLFCQNDVQLAVL